MADDWRCKGCNREIMSDENTHSFGGETWHSWCLQEHNKELKKQEVRG